MTSIMASSMVPNSLMQVPNFLGVLEAKLKYIRNKLSNFNLVGVFLILVKEKIHQHADLKKFLIYT